VNLLRLLVKPTSLRLLFGGLNFIMILLSKSIFPEEMSTLLLVQYVFNVIISITCLALSDLYYVSSKKSIYINMRTVILLTLAVLAIFNILHNNLIIPNIIKVLFLLIPIIIVKSWIISRFRLSERYRCWVLLHYGLPTLLFFYILIQFLFLEGDVQLFATLIQTVVVYIAIVLFLFYFVSRTKFDMNVVESDKNDVTMFRYILLSISLTVLPFAIIASHMSPNQLFILRLSQSIVSPLINIAQVAVRSDLLNRPLFNINNYVYIIVLFVMNLLALTHGSDTLNMPHLGNYLIISLICINLFVMQLVLLSVLKRILSGALVIDFLFMFIRILGIGAFILFLRVYEEHLSAQSYAVYLLIMTLVCFGYTFTKKAD
jgi:hypothetical protein